MQTKSMIKRSAFAVVILCLLGSLGVVVGEHLVTTTPAQDSPLFTTRILRATNQKQGIITPKYLGRGTKNFLNLQLQKDLANEVQQLLRILLRMDKKTMERWVAQGTMKGMSVENLSQVEPQILPTCDSFTACGNWAPGCYLKEILAMIIAFIKNGFQWPTYTWFCWPSGQIPCNVNIINKS